MTKPVSPSVSGCALWSSAWSGLFTLGSLQFSSAFPIHNFFFLIFIYLATLGLSCITKKKKTGTFIKLQCMDLVP